MKCNRNNVLSRIHINAVPKNTEVEDTDKEKYTSDFEDENSSENDIDKINFKITLSKEEWTAIQSEKSYQLKNSRYLKRYNKILKPGSWTEIVHSHFWEQTKIACTIIYKRAKIYESGFHYCVFYGKCKSCKSEIKGTLDEKPTINIEQFSIVRTKEIIKNVLKNRNVAPFPKKNYMILKN